MILQCLVLHKDQVYLCLVALLYGMVWCTAGCWLCTETKAQSIAQSAVAKASHQFALHI